MEEKERGITISPKTHLRDMAIIGHVGVNRTDFASSIVKILGEDKKMIVIGDYQEPSYDLEINGTKYKHIEREGKSYKTSRMLQIASMLYAPAMGMLDSSSGKLPMPKVDIVAEFTLIQNKDSKLSKREREWVVYQFNKQYYIV